MFNEVNVSIFSPALVRCDAIKPAGKLGTVESWREVGHKTKSLKQVIADFLLFPKRRGTLTEEVRGMPPVSLSLSIS